MKELEIRPKELFSKYLELSAADAKEFDESKFEKTNCVFCSSDKLKDSFSKHGFNYQVCDHCGSLMCNPRPSKADLSKFYSNSKSAKFWFDSFLPKVEEARRKSMFVPKAKLLISKLSDLGLDFNSVCDCGAGSGIFLEELKKIATEKNYSAIEPGDVSAKILSEKGIAVLKNKVEDSVAWAGQFDMVTSLEVLEHVFSPIDFVEAMYRLLDNRGVCLITTLGYDGFDIQVLKEESNSISPPHHLNFPSIKGVDALLKNAGFSETVIFTPGKLDVDIVLNSDYCPDFLKTIKGSGDQAVAELQNYLVKHNLSSHVWALGIK